MYGVEGSSDAISRDMDSLLYSSKFKHTSDGEFAKIKELISTDPYPGYSNHKLNQQNQNQNHEQQDCGDLNESSLMRYRSAPSSFFANLLNEDGCEDFLDPVAVVSSNHEPEERFFMRHQQQQQKSESDSRGFLQFSSSPPSMKQETKEATIQKHDLPPPSTTAAMYGGGSRGVPNLSPSSNNNNNSNNLESSSSFIAMNSTSSNLIRQSSSPAGFLSSLTVENGFAGMRDMGKGSSSSSRMNNNISFSSRTSSSSSRYLPQIAENSNEMNDSTINSLKRSRDGDLKMFSDLNGLDTQNGDSGHYTPSLVHHMSLPKTSSEMAAVEKFLQFQQDSVPCKIRAKRGYATHPRSIAERVRRTRISERMKKLQELFPNMDKQTNTADMLDMAVEYIKDLQKEVQILNEARARCTCSSKQLQSGSTK